MTPAPVSLAGAQPRGATGLHARQHASETHWSAAMDHAARATDFSAAPGADVIVPSAAEKIFIRASCDDEKSRLDASVSEKPSRREEPDDSAAKARGRGGAKALAGAHPAHAGQTSSPIGFMNLIFASGQAFAAKPASAATPAINRNEIFRAPSTGNSEQAAPAADTKTGSTQGKVSPGHAAPPAASAAGAVNADAVDAASSPVAAVQEVLPPPPAATANPAIPMPAPAANNFGGVQASSKAGAKLVGAERGVTTSVSVASRPLPMAAARTTLPPASDTMLASPVPGVTQVASGPVTLQAAPSPGGAPVPATPSALAAAVVAMQKSGDNSTILSLDPAGLGAMTVHVSIGQGSQVNVQFVPSLPQTAHLLNSNLDDLRQAMTAAGIALGQTSVRSDGGNAGGNGGYFSQPSRQGAASRSNPIAPALSNSGVAKDRFGGLSAYA